MFPMWIAYVVVLALMLALLIGWQFYSQMRIKAGKAKEKIRPTCGGYGVGMRTDGAVHLARKRLLKRIEKAWLNRSKNEHRSTR